MLDFILRPIRRRFGADRTYYKIVDDMFGFIPHNVELYKLALIHKSASLVLEDGRSINNERLEFLGDAVIEAVTSDYLYIEFPDRDEGFLTQLRSKIVSRQSLNALAVELGLDRQIISNGSAAIAQKHIFGDAFEAMMGAIYLDQGYEFVNRLLINRIYYRHLNLEELTRSEVDFKSRLIEWCQKNRHRVEFHTDHDKGYTSSRPLFFCKVLVDGLELGHGSGESKKEAEQQAALSVAQSLTDEQCASILDKVDRLAPVRKDAGRPAAKASERRGGNAGASRKTAPAGPAEELSDAHPAEAEPKSAPERRRGAAKSAAAGAEIPGAPDEEREPQEKEARDGEAVAATRQSSGTSARHSGSARSGRRRRDRADAADGLASEPDRSEPGSNRPAEEGLVPDSAVNNDLDGGVGGAEIAEPVADREAQPAKRRRSGRRRGTEPAAEPVARADSGPVAEELGKTPEEAAGARAATAEKDEMSRTREIDAAADRS